MVRFVTAPELVMELPNLFFNLHAERYVMERNLVLIKKFSSNDVSQSALVGGVYNPDTALLITEGSLLKRIFNTERLEN